MPRTFDLLVSDSHRAWTAHEIAQELDMGENEVTWDLEEAAAGGIARWVVHDELVLWFSSDVGGAVSLTDAYEQYLKLFPDGPKAESVRAALADLK